MANPLRFPFVMPCSQQPPTGFIVLCENIRSGRIGRSPVQQLHVSVNHWAMQCVRFAAKIFTDFTSTDFEAVKICCPCTALYGKTGSCTLLYAGFAYWAAIHSFANGRFYTLP